MNGNGKKNDLSPRKFGQIEVLFSETQLKQREIAQKLGVSTQIVSVIKKKTDSGSELGSKSVGRCGRNRIINWRTERQIVKMALKTKEHRVGIFLYT